MSLSLVDSPKAVTLAEVEHIFASARDRFLLLLLTEASVPKAKPGLPSIALRVLEEITDAGGPLDDSLLHFVKQRPRVLYHRLSLDRANSEVMTRIGVAWLPQVRLVRNERILFRSSVSVGDNGQFLAQDVGGKSFIRRTTNPSGLSNLLDALSAETDRTKSS